MQAVASPRDIAWLVYDDDCPVCRTYCRYVRIREAVGELRLVDARRPGPLMDEVTAAGLDIDQGMVLKFRDVVYYGADAIHMLSLLGTRSGLFNRVCYGFFGTRLGARVFYPVGKACRNVLLKLLRIPYIRNLDRPQATSSSDPAGDQQAQGSTVASPPNDSISSASIARTFGATNRRVG